MRLVAGLLIGDALGHVAAAIDFAEGGRISILQGFHGVAIGRTRAKNRHKGPLMSRNSGLPLEGFWRRV